MSNQSVVDEKLGAALDALDGALTAVGTADDAVEALCVFVAALCTCCGDEDEDNYELLEAANDVARADRNVHEAIRNLRRMRRQRRMG